MRPHGCSRAGVLAGQINPVFVGSAYKNKGIQELLSHRLLPFPLDVPEIDGVTLWVTRLSVVTQTLKSHSPPLHSRSWLTPYVGKLTLHSCLFIRLRQVRLQLRQGQISALAASSRANANDRVDREEMPAGDSRRMRWSKEHHYW